MDSCAKCGKELDTQGSPAWCKACRAKYQREYQQTRKEMAQGRGFAAGVTAMRGYLADRFVRYGAGGAFSGAEISSIIMQCKGPE